MINKTTGAGNSIRCGVFETVEQAEQAIDGLLEAGFAPGEISVVCSEKSKERHFTRYIHQQPAGANTAGAATAGSLLGALGAGLATIGLTSGGVVLLAAGPLAALGGAVAGGLIGAMLTRGAEKTLADFYDQAVERGNVLVGVEDTGPNQAMRLARADRVFREAGALPLPLERELELSSEDSE